MQSDNERMREMSKAWCFETVRMVLAIVGLAIPSFLMYWCLWTWTEADGYMRAYLTIVFSFTILCLSSYYVLNIRDEMNLKHLVVITGCDSGLGYSLALHCRDLGATVMAGVLEPTGKAIENLRSKGVIVELLDLTDDSSIKEFGLQVRNVLRDRTLVLRALINNAGVMIFGEFEWLTEKQVQQQIGVNFLGTTKVTRELMPIIRIDSSRIITVSSHCADEALPGLSIYSATKAALKAWTNSLRVELDKYGIKVISFIPGSFPRESNIMAHQKQHFEAMEESMQQEAKNFYGNYFIQYMQYFSSVSRKNSPKCLTNPNIYRKFNGALLDVYPSAIYRDEPWRYFFYYRLFKVTPTWLRDLLVIPFMQVPISNKINE